MNEKSLRLFYALWPDDKARARLQHLQGFTRGRRIHQDKLHMTLAFLGQQPAEKLPQLKNILADLPHSDIMLSIDHLGYFKKNRIAWAGMQAIPDALLELQLTLVKMLESKGITLLDNTGHFKPHVTLARDADPPADVPFDPIVWHAGHAALLHSTQENGKLIYRVLASRMLI